MSDSFDPTDPYKTLAGFGESEQVIDRSRFIGEALPVETEEEAETYVEETKSEHYDARHVCYGLRVGRGAQRIDRSNDDGEPPRTGGFPIWQVMDGEEVTNALCLVIRYYGGVKLGTGGLRRAYRTTARQAIDEAGIVEVFPEELLEIEIGYDRFGELEHLVETRDHVRIDDKAFTDEVALTLAVHARRLEEFRGELRGLLNRKIDG
jgi:uncharacterized YigZ family protein